MDSELLSYLKLPKREERVPSEVRDSDWAAPWLRACEENKPWLTMSYHSESGHFPWCALCGKWASVDHLVSQKCLQKRESWKLSPSPILEELCANWRNYGEGASQEPRPWRHARGPAPPEEEPPPQRAPPPAPAPGGLPREARRKCLNAYCDYLEHELVDEFRGYCCKLCETYQKENYKKKVAHGKRCQKEPAPMETAKDSPTKPGTPQASAGSAAGSSPEQPSSSNWRRAKAGGGSLDVEPEHEIANEVAIEEAADWGHSFQTKVAVSDIWATQGVDPLALPVQRRERGRLTGTTLVVVQIHEDAPEVLRMEVQDGLWVTLAERNPTSWSIISNFQEPNCTWEKVFRKAKYLSEAWYKADSWWSWAKKSYKSFEKVQMALCHALPQLETSPESMEKQIEERNAARQEALQQLEGFITAASKARKNACDWHGGCPRIDAVESARQWADELREGIQLNVDEEVKQLGEQHFKVTLNKNNLRLSDAELQNEMELQHHQGRGTQQLKDLKKERDNWRKLEKEETRKYFKQMAELSRKAERLAPELLPKLREHMEKQLSYQLSRLQPQEQAQVMQVLDPNISISHYEPDHLRLAKRLSKPGARHAVYEMTYAGSPCVVKVFDFHQTHHGLQGFIQEVVLHVRLKHPLVVPLRRAFIDHKEHRGFLQFDRYECNLEDHLSTQQPKQKHPHYLHEPPEAGMVDQMPRKITQMMVLSVAHVHQCGVVHGDLKPSNWLWDAHREVPILCDFETAKDHGLDFTQTSAMQSQGYAAPELKNSPRPTKESDVFALGKSIEKVLECVPTSHASERDELQSFVNRMICNKPSERMAAKDAAEESWWQDVIDGKNSYLRLVKADEVLYTQAECSASFSGGAHKDQPLQTLIDAIVEDPDYPLKDDRLIIDVIKKGLALFSVDNRRLYCFREAARTVWYKTGGTVWIKIREHKHEKVQERFVRHYDTKNAGKSIFVRTRQGLHR